jgi:hypothetical protein
MKQGAVRLEDLPEKVQTDILTALGEGSSKKPKLGKPLSKSDVLKAAAKVMAALDKSKTPPHQWYRILGQCQRWCRNPSRIYGVKKAPTKGL